MNQLAVFYKLLSVVAFFYAITGNSIFAQIPIGYKGKPFDNTRYISDYFFQMRNKEMPLTKYETSRVVWDAKNPVGFGFVPKTDTVSSVGLTVADSDGMQLIHYTSKAKKWNGLKFGWNWAAPGDSAIDPRQYDAISFAIKISGTTILSHLFFSLSENGTPVSLLQYNPAFANGSWHTITIPLRDFNYNLLSTAKDSNEVRGIIFNTYNWDYTQCDYQVYIDHISFDRLSKPVSNNYYKFPTITGQKIPGKIECAFFDEGGEGVAYHDTDPVNYLNGILNQRSNSERPNSNPYHWNFRLNEGVDLSFTKDGADLGHPNEFNPPLNQLYIGMSALGEWCNYSVDVEKKGTYKVFLVYGGRASTFQLAVNQGQPFTYQLPKTKSPHYWNRAEVGTINFPSAGINLLTLFVNTGLNYATIEFEKSDK